MAKHRSLLILLFIFNAVMTPLVAAEDRIDMEGISIIGNKELPNILYIVPWQYAEHAEITDPPLSTLINEALQPVNRESLLRHQSYTRLLKKQEQSQ